MIGKKTLKMGLILLVLMQDALKPVEQEEAEKISTIAQAEMTDKVSRLYLFGSWPLVRPCVLATSSFDKLTEDARRYGEHMYKATNGSRVVTFECQVTPAAQDRPEETVSIVTNIEVQDARWITGQSILRQKWQEWSGEDTFTRCEGTITLPKDLCEGYNPEATHAVQLRKAQCTTTMTFEQWKERLLALSAQTK